MDLEHILEIEPRGCFDVDKEKEESNICHFPGRLTQFFCP